MHFLPFSKPNPNSLVIAVEAAQEWMGFQVKDTTQMSWKAHVVSKPTETLLEMDVKSEGCTPANWGELTGQ